MGVAEVDGGIVATGGEAYLELVEGPRVCGGIKRRLAGLVGYLRRRAVLQEGAKTDCRRCRSKEELLKRCFAALVLDVCICPLLEKALESTEPTRLHCEVEKRDPGAYIPVRACSSIDQASYRTVQAKVLLGVVTAPA